MSQALEGVGERGLSLKGAGFRPPFPPFSNARASSVPSSPSRMGRRRLAAPAIPDGLDSYGTELVPSARVGISVGQRAVDTCPALSIFYLQYKCLSIMA